ncbi:MAG TPA: cytochrome c biogenesis protein CcdA [Jiangellaceae bacterium]
MTQKPILDGTGPDSTPRGSIRRRRIVALTAVVVTLLVAVGGALLTEDSVGGLNVAVERVSSWFGNTIDDLGSVVPLGFAFAAGTVSAFNPCGFPLLPTYLGLFLAEGSGSSATPVRRLGRSLAVGGTVTAGFVLLFAAAGLIFVLGTNALISWLPWLALSLGVVLVFAGGYLVAGGSVYTSLPERLGARIGLGRRGLPAYFLFGLTYGLASLSCTLPIFLAVIGTTLAGATATSSLGALVLYGIGMGLVITTLTVAMALFQSALTARLRGLLRYVGTIGTVALFLAGGYLVYYWLTIGGLLAGLT